MDIVCKNHCKDGTTPPDKKVGSFWWRDVLKNLPTYKELTHIKMGDGRTIQLWNDKWTNKIQAEEFPKLLSYVIKKDITVQQAMMLSHPHQMFHTPMSCEAYQQCQTLFNAMQEHHTYDRMDRWI